MAAPLAGILPGPASNSCGRLVTRPPPYARGRPLAELGGAAGRDPARSPWAAGPALGNPRDPRHPRPSGITGTPGPRGPPGPPAPLLPSPAAAGLRKPSPALAPARGSPCAGTVLPPWRQRAGRRWGHLVRRCGTGREKKPHIGVKHGAMTSIYPGRGGACLTPRSLCFAFHNEEVTLSGNLLLCKNSLFVFEQVSCHLDIAEANMKSLMTCTGLRFYPSVVTGC